jgi:hypothetical protein
MAARNPGYAGAALVSGTPGPGRARFPRRRRSLVRQPRSPFPTAPVADPHPFRPRRSVSVGYSPEPRVIARMIQNSEQAVQDVWGTIRWRWIGLRMRDMSARSFCRLLGRRPGPAPRPRPEHVLEATRRRDRVRCGGGTIDGGCAAIRLGAPSGRVGAETFTLCGSLDPVSPRNRDSALARSSVATARSGPG